MNWEALISIAVGLLEQVDKIFGYVRSLGISDEDIEKVVARNRKERADRLARDRANEWPDNG
jgi:hypothetical protein